MRKLSQAHLSVVATLFLLLIAGVVWFVVRPSPGHSDCDIVHEMVMYSQSQTKQLTKSGVADIGDHPEEVIAGYQDWATTMHRYADQIHDPVLHQIAGDLAKTDSDFSEIWAQNVRHPEPASTAISPSATETAFEQQYLAFGKRQHALTSDLQHHCRP